MFGACWVCLPDRYDDGGFPGGNIERPALKRLLADIEAGSSADANVACGVGASLFHKPWACIASIMALRAIGSPFALSTAAAASRQLIALGFVGAFSRGGFGAFGVFTLALFRFPVALRDLLICTSATPSSSPAPSSDPADRRCLASFTYVYRGEDAEFRERMRRAYHIAATVVLNMREGLARIRMAEALRRTADQFAVLPTKVANVAFLYGRAYGHWEAGKIEQIDLPDRKALAAEIAANEDLGVQLDELREIVGETVDRVVQGIHASVGRVHAAEVLSMWEGFGRFCRETLGIEPLTLVRAYGLQRDDPAAEVLTAYPDATPDEGESARLAERWMRSWGRRFA